MKSRRHRAINWAKLGRKVKNTKVIPYNAVFERLEDGTGVYVIDLKAHKAPSKPESAKKSLIKFGKSFKEVFNNWLRR